MGLLGRNLKQVRCWYDQLPRDQSGLPYKHSTIVIYSFLGEGNSRGQEDDNGERDHEFESSARFVHTYKERQRVKTEREMLRWREMSDK